MNGVVSVFVLCVSLVAATSPAKSECNKKDCPGPLKFYQDLGCKPIYKKEGDCCPVKYDCSHLDSRASDKCYFNGREYNIDQNIDRSPGDGCYPSCFCGQKRDKTAGFICPVSMPLAPPRPGCYRPRDAAKCWPEAEICFDKPEDVPTCQVDGKTINAGDFFEPKNEPEKACWCGPGYKGENVAPFCKDKTTESCFSELHDSFDAKKYCAPVFNVGRYPALDCHFQWRCHESGDKVTPGKQVSGSTDGQCKIGPLTLSVGDRLDKVIRGSCIKCSCDVPPVLSCQNLPKNACSEN